MQRGYEALVGGEALYEEIDAEQGRSTSIESTCRRADPKLAQAHAWLPWRELARDEPTTAARRAEHPTSLPTQTSIGYGLVPGARR